MGEEKDDPRHSFHDLAEEIREDTGELILSDLVDKDLLQAIQESFVEATGMVVGIFDNEFHSIIPNSPWTSYCQIVDEVAHERCLEADMEALKKARESSEPAIHKCYACDVAFFAAPIVIRGKVMGSILGGQVRMKPPDTDEVKSFADEIGADEEKLIKAAIDMKFCDEPQLLAWAKLLQSIANVVAQIGHERLVSSRLEASAEERATDLEHAAEGLEERIREQTGELRVSEIKFKNVFEESNDAIFIHTMEGEILEVNSRAEELLGYTEEELKKITVAELHTEDTMSQSQEAFERITDERSVRFDSKMKRKDGSAVPVEISSRFFKTNGDELIQGVVRDISERARFVSLLKKARDVLEQKVTERTAALTTSKRELEKKVKDLERWEDMLLEREMVIARLQEEVTRLRKMMAKKSKAKAEESKEEE